MRITKFGHACVRIEHDGHVLVIDPGKFTDPEAVDGATAVLVTHEHADHYFADNLQATDAPVYTIDAVARQIRDDAADVAERLTVVGPGESLDLGLAVRVVGEKHAVIHPEVQWYDNSGFLVTAGDQRVYHPGDSLTLPDEAIDVLLLPVSAPWLKASECIDFARDVNAPTSLGIHDMVSSGIGLAMVRAHLDRFLAPREQAYVFRKPGEDL